MAHTVAFTTWSTHSWSVGARGASPCATACAVSEVTLTSFAAVDPSSPAARYALRIWSRGMRRRLSTLFRIFPRAAWLGWYRTSTTPPST